MKKDLRRKSKSSLVCKCKTLNLAKFKLLLELRISQIDRNTVFTQTSVKNVILRIQSLRPVRALLSAESVASCSNQELLMKAVSGEHSPVKHQLTALILRVWAENLILICRITVSILKLKGKMLKKFKNGQTDQVYPLKINR